MFAIVDFKGFQYRVEKDATIKVSYLADAEIGSTVEIPNVLLIQNDDKTTVGTLPLNLQSYSRSIRSRTRQKDHSL